MLEMSRTPRRRTRREFAEQEIVIPDGPNKNWPWRVDVQPFAGLLLDAMDSGLFNRYAVLGPTQSGKSLNGYVIPLLYHLFECKENTILGLPDKLMATDKWKKDFLPVIRASRFADQLPTAGRGSRTDELKDSVTFNNHATLKVMAGTGADEARSGYTARAVGVTEADKMDTAGETSRETNKIGQLEARTDAYADKREFYMECTVSEEEGRIWKEYTSGTQSRIACPCPHCAGWVTPEREHLVGWQGAETMMDAREMARWVCPECGVVITEDERVEMNRRAVLVHKGQEVTPDGKVVGPMPRTRTLGFRWNAFNNLFWKAADVAERGFKVKQVSTEEDGETEMRQFVWAIPTKPAEVDLTQLDANAIARRIAAEERGFVPADADRVTIGLDIGKRLCHWACAAFRQDGSPHVVDYARFDVASDDMAMERALLVALRDFRDQVVDVGFAASGGAADEQIIPDEVWIDCGWVGEESEDLDEVVYAFCKESNELCGVERYMPAKGWAAQRYRHPTQKDKRVREIGDHYHVARIQEKRARLVHVNSDRGKGRVHDRWRTPIGKPGAMTLFHPGKKPNGDPDFAAHTSFTKHQVAEKQQERWKPGVGKVVEWVRLNRNNHWLDALMLALAAGHRAGSRLIGGLKRVARRIIGPAAASRPVPARVDDAEDAPAPSQPVVSGFGKRVRR